MMNRLHGSRGRALPALVIVQVVVAVIALGVMVAVAMGIRPLLEEKENLEASIRDYQTQIARYREDIERLDAQLAETQRELEETRERLEQTADMSRFTHPIDLVDLKDLFSRYPEAARGLELIMDMRERNVGWRLGGQSPDVGFDSPSFAAFVLQELGLLERAFEPGDSLLATSRRLYERLAPARAPEVGDLVFYPAGYVLFYYRDRDGRPFVIGMTPMGIAALDPDFAQAVGYRRSGLSQ
jgi:hypothetical protein